MRKPGHSLRLVAAALHGHLPEEAEWPAVIETANSGWLAPALYVALSRADRLNDIPPPVRDYLSFIHERNCERNRRMRLQLLEAARTLNAAAIEPVLLKGAIHLFTAAPEDMGARMLSDLDISIAPDEMARSKAALRELGYRHSERGRTLARPTDVGVIELHDRPAARSAHYLSADLRACSPAAEQDGAVARIPPATARALHLIVHDMIKEGDYWSLRIDLRHLHDFAGLVSSGEGVDWHQLCAMLPSGSARAALVVQARALEDLFGVPVPSGLRPGRAAELRHQARLVCAGRGPLAWLVRLVGSLSRGAHHLTNDYVWRGHLKFGQQLYRRLAARAAGSRV